MLPAAIKHAQGIRVRCQISSWPDFTEICNFFGRFSQKFSISNLNEIRPIEAALIRADRRTDMTKVTGALGARRKRLKTTEVIKLHYVSEPGLINYLTFLHENITDR